MYQLFVRGYFALNQRNAKTRGRKGAKVGNHRIHQILEMLGVGSPNELPQNPPGSKCKVRNVLTVCEDGESVIGIE